MDAMTQLGKAGWNKKVQGVLRAPDPSSINHYKIQVHFGATALNVTGRDGG